MPAMPPSTRLVSWKSLRAALAAGAALVASACSADDTLTPTVSEPEGRTTVLDRGDAYGLSLAASRSLYEEAPVVVLATDGKLRSQAPAAAVAVGLGVPLLLTPREGQSDGDRRREPQDGAAVDADGKRLVDELARLSTETVVTLDAGSERWVSNAGANVEVVDAPTDVDALAETTSLSLAGSRAVPARSLTREVAELSRERLRLLAVRGAAPSEAPRRDGDADGAEMPEHQPPSPLDSLTVVASGAPANVAAIATGRAAGARVLVATDGDPRVDGDVIAALAEDPPEKVLGVGDQIGDGEQFRRRVEVAATGVELPGGGQVFFPHRRVVALYGHPDSPDLGALGEQPLRAAIARARRLARQYEPHSEMPVIPGFEIIASIASGSAGDDGNYSILTEVRRLRRWVDAAGDAGMYVVLDLQPGRTDFLTQARHYEELLAEPHVGLALDPEWRLKPGQVHLSQIGSVEADEVNSVVDWLADLTRRERLPQKLLILHQFQVAMISNRQDVDTSRDELAILVHADGHGTRDLKRATWRALTEKPLDSGWWGWKNFYDEDDPTWTPEETTAMKPPVLFISYQ